LIKINFIHFEDKIIIICIRRCLILRKIIVFDLVILFLLKRFVSVTTLIKSKTYVNLNTLIFVI